MADAMRFCSVQTGIFAAGAIRSWPRCGRSGWVCRRSRKTRASLIWSLSAAATRESRRLFPPRGQSLNVALVQDRFVLGGNGSSEVRVWAQGGTLRGKYPHLGEIVEEFADHVPDSPAAAKEFVDERKEASCSRREKYFALPGALRHFGHDERRRKDHLRHGPGSPHGARARFRAGCSAIARGTGRSGAMAGAKYNMEPARPPGHVEHVVLAAGEDAAAVAPDAVGVATGSRRFSQDAEKRLARSTASRS